MPDTEVGLAKLWLNRFTRENLGLPEEEDVNSPPPQSFSSSFPSPPQPPPRMFYATSLKMYVAAISVMHSKKKQESCERQEELMLNWRVNMIIAWLGTISWEEPSLI